MLSSARVRALRHATVTAAGVHNEGTSRGQRFADSFDEPRGKKAYGVSSVNPVFNPPSFYECDDDDVFDTDDTPLIA